MIILHFQNLVQMNCSPLPTDIQQERLHPTFTIPCLPPTLQVSHTLLGTFPLSLGGGREFSTIKRRRSVDCECFVIAYIACYWPFLGKR